MYLLSYHVSCRPNLMSFIFTFFLRNTEATVYYPDCFSDLPITFSENCGYKHINLYLMLDRLSDKNVEC